MIQQQEEQFLPAGRWPDRKTFAFTGKSKKRLLVRLSFAWLVFLGGFYWLEKKQKIDDETGKKC